MVPPTPASPPGQMPTDQFSHETQERTASRILSTYGFHLLALLLGIALAFM